MRKLASIVVSAAVGLQPIAAVAGTKDFALQGYALPADKPVTVALMRPDVAVGELAAGGLPQPNADWTNAARGQIEKALKAELAGRSINFSNMDEQVALFEQGRVDRAAACAGALAPTVMPAPAGEEPAASTAAPHPVDCAPAEQGEYSGKPVAEYQSLHSAVVQAILAHKYGMGAGKLPTKKEAFSYTLGPGTARLGTISGSNYGLFVMTNDQFASGSRKAMQVMGALGCLVGACVIVKGGTHVAYVSLVELETGNIVWFNVLRGSQGDVREEDGARDMVRSIMASMPTRPGQISGASAAKSR